MRYLVDLGRLIPVEEKSAGAAAAAAVIDWIATPNRSRSPLPPVILVHELATGSIEAFRFGLPPACTAPRREADA